MNLYKPFKIYQKCPEIRGNLRLLLAIRTVGIATIIIFLPLFFIAFVFGMAGDIFTFMSKLVAAPADSTLSKLWLYYQSHLSKTHKILALKIIQSRIGDDKDE